MNIPKFLQVLIVAVPLALSGCLSAPTTTPRFRKEAPSVVVPGVSPSKKPAPSSQITIIHIRPENRNYANP